MRLPDDFPREIEALALDLDHTLVGEDRRLRPRTVAALHAARDAGIRPVIVTGRMFQSARPFALEAGADGPLVCYQGGYVADARSGRVLSHRPIPLDTAREAIATIQEAGFGVNCYVDDELYVAEVTEEARFYAAYQGTPLEVHAVGDLLAWLDRPPTKLVVVGRNGGLDSLEGELDARFAGRLHIVRSIGFFLELGDVGVTKGAGLDVASRAAGFHAGRTVGFGDNQNDVELLEWAAYGVAVANAHPRLLALADFVCPSVEDEGVAQVIEAFLELDSAR